MSKRSVIAILIVAMIAIPACSDGAGGDDGSRTIRLYVSGEPEENRIYETIVDTFREQNPDIDVALTQTVGTKEAEAEDELAKLAAAFAAGEAPEIFLINYREYSQFVASGGVVPIGPLLEEDGVDLSAYYPQPIEAFTFDGELQCMPQNISSLVVYYNRALFRDAGVAPPKAGWSWDEFRDTAIEMTSGDVIGLGLEPKIIRVAPFVWGNGGELVDDADNPTRFTFDDPSSREALEFVLSLARDDKVIPSEEEGEAEAFEDQFVSGDMAMFLGSRRDTPKFREVVGFDWDIAPLPLGREPAGILHSDAYCISEGTENVEDAVKFIEFATGPQGEQLGALSGRVVPALKAVAVSPAFLDPSQPPRHPRVFLDGIPFIRRTPVIPTWAEIEERADEILTRAFYEPDYTLEDALNELEEETADLFEEGSS